MKRLNNYNVSELENHNLKECNGGFIGVILGSALTYYVATNIDIEDIKELIYA
ncbi:hypothetical protein KUL113_49320 [Tenacibaculum sp. KUL113]|nr:hypothetical protein KUL113_49320 [Tenacibaculum sp. KUL113]